MLILGTRNATAQTVATGAIINLGSTYKKFCQKTEECLPTFVNNGTSVTLNGQGFYHITATLVGTGTVAGDVTVQLNANSVAVPAALSTQTITTPTTEIRTFVIDTYIMVNSTYVLGREISIPETITLTNTGVGATFTAVTVNIDKVVVTKRRA